MDTIDDATLAIIQSGADNYFYEECEVASISRAFDDSNIITLGTGQSFTMPTRGIDDDDDDDDGFGEDESSVTVSEGAICEVVDMGGDFYRIYNVEFEGKAYTLTDT